MFYFHFLAKIKIGRHSDKLRLLGNFLAKLDLHDMIFFFIFCERYEKNRFLPHSVFHALLFQLTALSLNKNEIHKDTRTAIPRNDLKINII